MRYFPSSAFINFDARLRTLAGSSTSIVSFLMSILALPFIVPSFLLPSIHRSRNHHAFHMRRAEPTRLDELPDAFDVLALLPVVAIVVDAEGGTKEGHGTTVK